MNRGFVSNKFLIKIRKSRCDEVVLMVFSCYKNAMFVSEIYRNKHGGHHYPNHRTFELVQRQCMNVKNKLFKIIIVLNHTIPVYSQQLN